MALTPDEIDGLRELILAVYGPVTEELLRDLCRCITAAGQISSGDEYTAFGHSVEYWERNPSFTFTEIFAELFTMETQGDSDLYFVKTLFPELWDEYQKLF